VDAAVAAAWAGVVVAFAAVGVSYYQTRQNHRALAVAERQAAIAEAALPSPPPPVGWEVRPAGGEDKWAMVNVGREIAHNVEIDRERAVGASWPQEEGRGIPSIRPGASIRLYNLRTMGMPSMQEVWVRWEGQEEWVAVPLPPGWN